jgi:hypothetical protein
VLLERGDGGTEDAPAVAMRASEASELDIGGHLVAAEGNGRQLARAFGERRRVWLVGSRTSGERRGER